MKTRNKKIWFGAGVVGVGGLHFLLSAVVAFAAGMGHDPSLRLLSNILVFPLGILPASLDLPGPFGWVLWVGVSLCWGYGICAAVRFMGKGKKA